MEVTFSSRSLANTFFENTEKHGKTSEVLLVIIVSYVSPEKDMRIHSKDTHSYVLVHRRKWL